jgi:hypothetical protein
VGLERGPLSLMSTYKTLSDIYLQSQLRVFIDVFSPISQHVSAPPGHPQVNHNLQLYYLKKAIVAIAGICLIEFYIYITQQDATHKNKTHEYN